MMGTRTPNLSRVSTILGTARAASSVFTVTRTSSEPAVARAITWLTVEVTSAVSVLVIDWTTTGCELPTFTEPIWAVTERRRACAAMQNPPHSGTTGVRTFIVAWEASDHRFERGKEGRAVSSLVDHTERTANCRTPLTSRRRVP